MCSVSGSFVLEKSILRPTRKELKFCWPVGVDIGGVHAKFERFLTKVARFVTCGRFLGFLDGKKCRKCIDGRNRLKFCVGGLHVVGRHHKKFEIIPNLSICSRFTK